MQTHAIDRIPARRPSTPAPVLFLVASVAFCAAACSTAAPAAGPPLPLVVEGFDMPESVTHDPVADVYLVSNIEGSPFDADGRGFISRVAPDGRMLARRWIDGLNAPKGLAVSGDVLAVADLTVLRRFDRASGQPRGVVAVPGATFLNDVAAAGPEGAFYVSDSGMGPGAGGLQPTGTDAIYRVGGDGQVSAIARGVDLTLPNGLAVTGDPGELVMAPFGGKTLVRFGLDGARHGSADLPAGQLDGVVALSDGCLLVSSLEARSIFVGPAGGPFTAGATDVVAADIGLDSRRQRLLLPLIGENRLRVVPVAAVVSASAACSAQGR
jgi:hypothetical protein